MLKAIFAKHVLAGDHILLPGGERITVAKVEISGGKVRLKSSHPVAELEEYDIVGLGHRPWTKGKTQEQMRESVMHCVRSVDRIPYGRSGVTPVSEEIDRQVEVLGKIIADYELGKPEGK